jgi:hypothetical protein
MGVPIDRLLTATRLREAVRANLRMGVTKDAISLLILGYVPPEARTDRTERYISRQALENIPPGRRAEFLSALLQMATQHGLLRNTAVNRTVSESNIS